MSKFVGQPGVNAKERRSSLRIISRNDDTKFERNFTNTQLWKGRTANIGKMKRSILLTFSVDLCLEAILSLDNASGSLIKLT